MISISIPEGKHDAAMLLPKVICMTSKWNEISETEIKCFVRSINKTEWYSRFFFSKTDDFSSQISAYFSSILTWWNQKREYKLFDIIICYSEAMKPMNTGQRFVQYVSYKFLLQFYSHGCYDEVTDSD